MKDCGLTISDQNPSAGKIHELFTAEGEVVKNDHIAFRTFNVPKLSIEVLAEPFIAGGYVEKGEYYFAKKHLEARHFELPGDPDAPRVFISQLVTGDFSDFLQNTVTEIIGCCPVRRTGSGKP